MQRVDDDSSLHVALFLPPKDTSEYLSSCSNNAALAERIWRQKLSALMGSSTDNGQQRNIWNKSDMHKSKRAYYNAYYEVRKESKIP